MPGGDGSARKNDAVAGGGGVGREGERGTAGRAGSVAAAVVLAASCLLVNRCHQPPTALGVDAPPEFFSAGRAYERLERLLGDETPHPLGTAANDAVRERLIAELEDLGLQPAVNERWVPQVGRRMSSLFLTRNVVAELPSSRPDLPAIVLACHYDSVPAGPGASDDGAGVAAILEVARILQAEAPLSRPVVLLFTDGEELGLFGARGFAMDNPLADRVGMILNFEARGSSGGSLMFETSRHNRWIITQVAGGLARPMSSSAYVDVYRLMPNSSDLTVFLKRDLAGMNFAYIGRPKHYHTPLDNLANLDKRSLQHHGENALGMVRQLLVANWDGADRQRGDAVYTDLFARWIIAWPARWGPWMAGSVLAAMVVAFRVFRRRLAWRFAAIAGATSCWLLMIAVAAGTGWLGAWLLKVAGASSTPFPAGMHFDVAVHCLFAATGVVVTLCLFRPNPVLLFMLHGVGLALLATVSSFTLAGFSYLFLMPAVLCLAAVLLLLQVPPPRVRLAAACLCLAFLTAVIGFPILIRLPQALGVVLSAPAVGAVVALLLLPVAPLLGELRRWSLYQAALGLALLTGGIIFLSVKTPAFSPDAPQQITLSYLEEIGSTHAQVSLSSWEAPVPDSLVEGYTRLKKPNPVFPREGFAVGVTSAGLTAPEAALLDWNSADGLHTGRVRLKPSRASQQIVVIVPASLALEKISSQGMDLTMPAKESDDRRWLRFRGLPGDGIELTLSWRGSPELSLVVAGVTPGLPALLDQLAATRDELPACTAHMGDVTIVYREIVLTP